MRSRAQSILLLVSLAAVVIVFQGFTFAADPVADPGGPYSGRPGQPILFDGSGFFDPDGAIVEYRWDFGRGRDVRSPLPFASHSFDRSGDYEVELEVRDDSDRRGRARTQVQIQSDDDDDDDEPEANDDVASTDEDTSVLIDVLQNDDVQGGTVVDVTSPSNGAAVQEGDFIRYTPAANFNGEDQFQYTVANDEGSSNANVVVTVLPVNDPPVATDDAAATDAATPVEIDVLANDSDADGDVLNVQDFTQGSSGSVNSGPGTQLTYTPNSGFSGNDTFTYTLSDGQGGTALGTVSVTVTSPANQEPNALIDSPAGNTTIQAGQSIAFAGHGEDADGSIVSYSWSFPGGIPSSSSSQNPGEVTFLLPGVYQVSFNVTDDDGASDPTPATRTVTVTVLPPPNQAPNATIDSPAGNVTIQAGQSVSFAGTGTDPDGTIVGHSWSFPGGSPSSSTAEDPGAVTFPSSGVFVVSFNVTDDGGASDPTPATRTITVTPASGTNQPPNATIDSPAGNVTIQAGQGVTFAGTGTDPDAGGTIVAYSWSFPGGTPASSTAEDPGIVTFASTGVFVVSFNVTDDAGASDPTPPSRTITVTPASGSNQPPNAAIDQPAGNVTIPAGRTVTFAGTGTDPDGSIVAHSWAFQGGTPSSSSAEDPGNVAYLTPGVYSVTYNVTDNRGASDPSPATRTITVTSVAGQNQPPNTEIEQPASNVTIQAGQSVNFQGRATDGDGQIVSYDWNFGGGVGNGSVEDPGSVRFPNPGVYTVTFNATDDRGASDPSPARRTVTVTSVSPSNQPPSATIDEPSGSVTVQAGQSVTFRGTGRDSDGSVVAHLWTFGGGAPNRNVEDPGAVVFENAGVFTVSYNVTDDGGASDPTPPSIVVTVEGTGGGGGNVADFNVEAGMPGSADRVDGHDVIFVLRAVLTQDLRADVNGDGIVDQEDVQLTLAALGMVE